MGKTALARIVESANIMDILFYIHDHPGCMKSEIYQNVTRNAHTKERLEQLASEGLLTISESANGRSTSIMLTDMGNGVTEILMKADSLLSDDSKDAELTS